MFVFQMQTTKQNNNPIDIFNSLITDFNKLETDATKSKQLAPVISNDLTSLIGKLESSHPQSSRTADIDRIIGVLKKIRTEFDLLQTKGQGSNGDKMKYYQSVRLKLETAKEQLYSVGSVNDAFVTSKKSDDSKKNSESGTENKTYKNNKEDVTKEKIGFIPLQSLPTHLVDLFNKVKTAGTIYSVADYLNGGRSLGVAKQNEIVKNELSNMKNNGLISEQDIESIKAGDWKDENQLNDLQKQQVRILMLLCVYEATRGAGYAEKFASRLKDAEPGDVISMMQAGREKGGITELMGLTGVGRTFWGNISKDISKEVPTEVILEDKKQETLEQILEKNPSPLYDYLNKSGGEPYARVHNLLDSEPSAEGTQLSEKTWSAVKDAEGKFSAERFNLLVQEVSGIYENAEDFKKVAPIVDMLKMPGFDIEACKKDDYYSVDMAFDKAKQLVIANIENKFFTMEAGKEKEIQLIETLISRANASPDSRISEDERMKLFTAMSEAGWLVESDQDGSEDVDLVDKEVMLSGKGLEIALALRMDAGSQEDFIDYLFNSEKNTDYNERGKIIAFTNAALEVIYAEVGGYNAEKNDFSQVAKEYAEKNGLDLKKPEGKLATIKEISKGGKIYADEKFKAFENGVARVVYYNSDGTLKTSQTIPTEKDAKVDQSKEKLVFDKIDKLLSNEPKTVYNMSDLGPLSKAIFYKPGADFNLTKDALSAMALNDDEISYLVAYLVKEGAKVQDVEKITAQDVIGWVEAYYQQPTNTENKESTNTKNKESTNTDESVVTTESGSTFDYVQEENPVTTTNTMVTEVPSTNITGLDNYSKDSTVLDAYNIIPVEQRDEVIEYIRTNASIFSLIPIENASEAPMIFSVAYDDLYGAGTYDNLKKSTK